MRHLIYSVKDRFLKTAVNTAVSQPELGERKQNEENTPAGGTCKSHLVLVFFGNVLNQATPKPSPIIVCYVHVSFLLVTSFFNQSSRSENGKRIFTFSIILMPRWFGQATTTSFLLILGRRITRHKRTRKKTTPHPHSHSLYQHLPLHLPSPPFPFPFLLCVL